MTFISRLLEFYREGGNATSDKRRLVYHIGHVTVGQDAGASFSIGEWMQTLPSLYGRSASVRTLYGLSRLALVCNCRSAGAPDETEKVLRRDAIRRIREYALPLAPTAGKSRA